MLNVANYLLPKFKTLTSFIKLGCLDQNSELNPEIIALEHTALKKFAYFRSHFKNN